MDFKDSLGTHSRVLILSPGNPRSDGPWFLSATAPPSDGREDFSQMDRTEMGFQKKGLKKKGCR